MSTGTRAARAATSRQAKQEIVRLLFGPKFSKTNHEGHKRLDWSIYSYADLKKAYLERVQEIHPDKLKQKQQQQQQQQQQPQTTTLSDQNDRQSFHELQNAWDKYEEMAKAMKTFNNGGVSSNFTKFGVGCSFSDNDEERALRDEITDQACRGWFSSGALAATTTTTTNDEEEEDETAANKVPLVSLVDDSMFESVVEGDIDPDNTLTKSDATKEQDSSPSRRKLVTLIPGVKIR